MTPAAMLRSLTALPDHGHGPLGQLAHALLTDHLSAAPAAGQLHLGYNTLPGPPYFMPAALFFTQLPGEPRAALNLRLLADLAQSLRSETIRDPSSFTAQERSVQRLLRPDSIALVCEGRELPKADSAAAQAVTADLLTGKDPRTISPAVARPVTVCRLADRDGTQLAGWVADGEIMIAPQTDLICAMLGDIIQAQYDWTAASFGVYA